MKDCNVVIIEKMDNIVKTIKHRSLNNAVTFALDIRSLAFDLDLNIELLIGGILYDRLYQLNSVQEPEVTIDRDNDAMYSKLIDAILEIKKVYMEDKEVELNKSLVEFMRISLRLKNELLLSEPRVERRYSFPHSRG